MSKKLVLKKQPDEQQILNGTFPGVYDFDQLIETDTDGYREDGEILFKFRKRIVPESINDNFHKLADICVKSVSLRSDAAGHQLYEESRLVGFDLNRRSHNYVSETQFTRHEHAEYKKLIPVIELVNDIYRKEFPKHYYSQANLNVDPHFLIGRTVFNQCIFNKSFRTCLHRDKGNAEGIISNMICLGDQSYAGGYLVFPEYRIAIDVRPRDYLGFMGREIWHGNTEITGSGTRLTIVCYLKREIVGRRYEDEILKMAENLEEPEF